MEIQSLSITVPTDKCINNCKFCCSKLHPNNYQRPEKDDEYYHMIADRLLYATQKGVDTIILTSANGEPLQNAEFLAEFARINKSLPISNQIINIELQTTGVLLDNYNLNFLKNCIGVKTISLSLSSTDSMENSEICGIKEKFGITDLCHEIKKAGFNLRLSLNMTNEFDDILPYDIFNWAHYNKADQITFRKLFSGDDNSNPINEWIEKNECSGITLNKIETYIKHQGTMLEKLSFGSMKYSVKGMSTVIDDNCMATKNSIDFGKSSGPQVLNRDWIDQSRVVVPFEEMNIRYYIIREDGRLYTRWNDKGSLIF